MLNSSAGGLAGPVPPARDEPAGCRGRPGRVAPANQAMQRTRSAGR